MKNGLNAYFEKNNISLSAYINYTNSATIIPTQYDLSFGGTTKTENNIKLMLDRDFPVIIAIGIMEGVTLYYDNPNEIIKKPLQIDRFQFEIYDEYDAHNVTITEFITDEISQKKWMKVQSWSVDSVTITEGHVIYHIDGEGNYRELNNCAAAFS